MTAAATLPAPATFLAMLSDLLLRAPESHKTDFDQVCNQLSALPEEEVEAFLTLANAHHVIVRALQALQNAPALAKGGNRVQWSAVALDREQARIDCAISFLDMIVRILREEGCAVTVIKSLDHWPDLGSDLDLYTNADPTKVIRIMTRRRLNAKVATRSWGDRLAGKWNFLVPGLPEAVEIHMGRLGQTGEQTVIGKSLIDHAKLAQMGSRALPVARVEDRLMIATLQRMYRHFYFRLCDIVDTVRLLETERIDYQYLYSAAEAAGIWAGVASYLTIVSGYVQQYRGKGLDLPAKVRLAARLGDDDLAFDRGFLRVPIMPQSVKLYASELSQLIANGQLEASARLSLLPGLATAAALGYKLTGSDKGIW